MLFSNFFKKNQKDKLRLEEEKKYVKIENNTNESGFDVLDLCEQLIEASSEFEDIRQQYIKQTNYYNDCLKIEQLLENESQELKEIATNLTNLNITRNELINSESKMSDTQFSQIQEIESEIPRIISRLKNNEIRLDSIKKNMKFIEGEKVEWEITREDCKKEQRNLRYLSIVILFLFALVCVSCVVASVALKVNTQLWMFIAAAVAVLVSAYIVIKYQECNTQIKQCDVNVNHAITLMNKTKIKFVNVQNAVSYTCERFHVKNSYELNVLYDLYIDTVREKEKFRKTSDELEYYNKQFLDFLDKNEIYESKIWLNRANAILNKDEMVEIKQDILERRQKSKSSLGYCVDNIADIRAKIVKNKQKLGDKVEQVNEILRRVAQLNTNLPDR